MELGFEPLELKGCIRFGKGIPYTKTIIDKPRKKDNEVAKLGDECSTVQLQISG